MDFETARQFVLGQTSPGSDQRPDTFIACLRQGRPPVPGQVTSLLLALKVIFEGLRQEPSLDRPLVQSLLVFIQDSPALFQAGLYQGVQWPPLLQEDLARLSRAATAVIKAEWQD
ncbi:MAG: Dethiobiotin synthetase [Cyanobacteria bacterium REEB459]|nr:Dethiobiotin synthetase [Cyanobacteria bacterium REEB459]